MGYDMMWIHDYMATLYRSSQRKRTGFQGARKGESWEWAFIYNCTGLLILYA